MEALSDVLSLFRLSASIYNNAQFCGNWKVKEHQLGSTCFHLVTVGQCKMTVPNVGDYTLNLGDLVVFPRELDHQMVPTESDLDNSPMKMIAVNPDQPGTALLCGELRFQHNAFNQLLDLLPEVLVIPKHQAPWIDPLLFQIHFESVHRSPGGEAILNRLSELLFIYALRHYLQSSNQGSFLQLYSHDELTPALRRIHKQPNENWTLEQLAQACAMSRTKFATHFKKVSGWTPNEYILWWRMQLAWSQLESGDTIANVALSVGYQSEAAFSRAFKKMFSVNPGALRRQKM